MACIGAALAQQKGVYDDFINTKLPKPAQADTPKYQPSVLIEHFSSEGCSSCPEGDKFMAELIHISDSSNTPVHIIDFHVDIWNKSGWIDPYSDSLYTNRQKKYLEKKNLADLYTPMAVCNGKEIWPGMAKKEIGKFIGASIIKPSAYYLGTKAQKVPNEDSLEIGYSLWGNGDSCFINVALVQQEMKSLITSGDNANKTLVHHNVVKFFYTRPLNGNRNSIKVAIPDGIDLTKYRLITYLQHQRTWEVMASDQLFFNIRN